MLELKLCKEILVLEDENNKNSEILKANRNELIEIRRKKLKGKLIRSREKWIEQGKKLSKYFCNLELIITIVSLF